MTHVLLGNIVFVFVKTGKSAISDYFGPATPGECRSWMIIKKLRPVSFHDCTSTISQFVPGKHTRLLKNNTAH